MERHYVGQHYLCTYVEILYILHTALDKAICTLGNWIYVQNIYRSFSRRFLTNFVSSSLMQLYIYLTGPTW